MSCFLSFPFEGECGSSGGSSTGGSTGGSTGAVESGSVQSDNYPSDYPVNQVPYFVLLFRLSFVFLCFNVFHFCFENMILKTCHLFDRPGQDLRDQCGCREKDQDDLRCIQPRERLEMRLGLSGGI